jgi:hypothetical protein
MAYAFPSSGGGVWTLVDTQTASNQASVAFTTGISSTYKQMKIVMTGLRLVDSGGQALWMRCSTNGGSSYDSGANYSYNEQYFGSDSSNDWNRSSADSRILLVFPTPISANATDTGSMELDIFNLGQATYYMTVLGNATANKAAVNYTMRISGSYNVASSVDAFQFLGATANIFAGNFYLYGLS